MVYNAQGKHAEAEPFYKRALAIYEKALGPEHPHVAISLVIYAALLRETGRGAEAAKLEARAKAIRAKHTILRRPHSAGVSSTGYSVNRLRSGDPGAVR